MPTTKRNFLGDIGGRSAFANKAGMYAKWLGIEPNQKALSGTNIVMEPLCKLDLFPITDALVFTIFEKSILTKRELLLLSKARAICVPTPCVRALKPISRSVPIVGINYGIDSAFVPNPDIAIPGRVFLTAGRPQHGFRKDLMRVINAFLAAFPTRTDVVLQVKIPPDATVPDVRCSRIQYITDDLSTTDMARWYNQGLAFVSPSWGEGWGLHEHEAMACGKAIISTCKTGVMTLVGWDAAYVVDSTKVSGYWRPSYDSLIDKFQQVAEDISEAFVRGKLLCENVVDFTTKAERKAVLDFVKLYA